MEKIVIPKTKSSPEIIMDYKGGLLEIIGEACGSLSDEFKEANPIVEWQALKDMRNILIHQYFGVDYKRVYLVVKNEIPDLASVISHLMEGNSDF